MNVDRCALFNADAFQALKDMPDNSIDSVVTDPPYELGFMGKAWDGSGIAFSVELWREVLRVLKPGGHMLAFGGTRTYHRMTCAIEDAGFEIRDSLHWFYGTGFPKSLNVAKAIDATDRFGGSGSVQLRQRTGLPTGTVGSNKGKHRSGANDVGGARLVPPCECGHPGQWHDPDCAFEGCSCPRWKEQGLTPAASEWDGWGTALKPGHEPIVLARKPLSGTVAANVLAFGTGALNIDASRIASRWPANVLLDEDAAGELDEQSGTLTSGARSAGTGARVSNSREGGALGDTLTCEASTGGASRFFYVAKPSGKERDLGCEHLAPKSGGEATEREEGSAGVDNPRAGAGRGGGRRNYHPTVKPIELMQYLVRLITPTGGIVLDPFTGSGTTGMAAIAEGFSFVGVERELEYLPITLARLQYALDRSRIAK